MLSWATFHSAAPECKNNTLSPFCLLGTPRKRLALASTTATITTVTMITTTTSSSLLLIATHLLSKSEPTHGAEWTRAVSCGKVMQRFTLDGWNLLFQKMAAILSNTLIPCPTLWYHVPHFDAMSHTLMPCASLNRIAIFFVLHSLDLSIRQVSWAWKAVTGFSLNKPKYISAQSQAYKKPKPIWKSWKASVPIAPVGTCPEKTTIGTPSVKASCRGNESWAWSQIHQRKNIWP